MSREETEMGRESAPVLTATGIRKQFFGVEVLHGVDLAVRPGTVHGLVGENGAGKSTLMKIIAGVHRRDGGDLLIDGRPVDFAHPLEAARAGVATVFQEFNLLPDRTVAQNVFLGREPRRRGLVDVSEMNRATQELLDDLGIEGIGPETKVGWLTVAEQQIVEIIKALSVDARVISMDEPTAALAEAEVAVLYRVIGTLRSRGVAIVYVSHRLQEVFDLCDDITVLKDGALVASRPAADFDQAGLVRAMVGRPISTFFPGPEEGTEIGDPVLEVSGGGNEQLDGICLSLRSGEIVGLAGLQGSGRSELVSALFGAAPFTRGTMGLDGSPVTIRSPRQGVRAGIALVTEDRKGSGLALSQSILDNALLAIRAVFPGRTAALRSQVPGILDSLEVISRGTGQEVRALSGGNQQKVVLAKWLATSPRVVLLDEPTRGIDVGAKIAVYRLIRDLARRGVAIVLVSSELPEVLGMSDRVLVMADGRISGQLPPSASEEEVLALATGTEAQVVSEQ
ncbi:monosaccharide ABC transporter ATP-binding protein (CUT2 family) [Brevibacterium sanguinis]|uniref:Monosaccharide ABC transporter ATP-binding protein (CUT2 family) n=2 Tax=Brevibacterium TaxID=1696 RepID=A0A366IJR4_9MICO|nr:MULTISPECIES: sugar ABC transporter ATP-binding protein [Brevibacterium]RBP65116.1 monosaccharide ABC transporter ATP-binding protein (CUT2 family) [Brevibacterium sanguinis]RBP71379.1 monosaccharide ABC transporter ATP-binding protein (CUT2 family) [Brevibacterium celere]